MSFFQTVANSLQEICQRAANTLLPLVTGNWINPTEVLLLMGLGCTFSMHRTAFCKKKCYTELKTAGKANSFESGSSNIFYSLHTPPPLLQTSSSWKRTPSSIGNTKIYITRKLRIPRDIFRVICWCKNILIWTSYNRK